MVPILTFPVSTLKWISLLFCSGLTQSPVSFACRILKIEKWFEKDAPSWFHPLSQDAFSYRLHILIQRNQGFGQGDHVTVARLVSDARSPRPSCKARCEICVGGALPADRCAGSPWDDDINSWYSTLRTMDIAMSTAICCKVFHISKQVVHFSSMSSCNKTSFLLSSCGDLRKDLTHAEAMSMQTYYINICMCFQTRNNERLKGSASWKYCKYPGKKAALTDTALLRYFSIFSIPQLFVGVDKIPISLFGVLLFYL